MFQIDGTVGPVAFHFLPVQSAGVVAWIAVAVLLTLGWVVSRTVVRRRIRVRGSQPPWLEEDLARLRRILTWFVLVQLGLQALAVFLLAAGPSGVPGGMVLVAGFASMLLGLVAVAWLAEQIPRRAIDRRLAARRQEVIPVCMHCRNARDAHLPEESLQFGVRRWRPITDLLAERDLVRFSHGICPDCVEQADRERTALPADYDVVGEVDLEEDGPDTRSGSGGSESGEDVDAGGYRAAGAGE